MSARIEIPSEGRAIVSTGERKRPEPDREEVARLAYSFWQRRKGAAGNAEEDWLRAEEQLRRRNEFAG